jgi:RND family efflux transporter MFP subunit
MTHPTRYAAAALALLLAACAEESPPPEVLRPVLVRAVGGDAPAGVDVYSGEVRARHEADLGFRIGGKILARLVDVGSTVRRGQALARLDPQDAQLNAAAAASQVAAAQADAALARADLERFNSLYEQKFVSKATLDARRTQAEAADARLRAARAQAGVAGNQADYATLVSDRDGVVTATPAEAGQVVAAGQPVLRVARPQEREVLIHVPESRIAAVRAARGVQARLWAQPQKTYSGRVREIAPNADAATRSFAVRVALTDADAAVALGMTATVAFDGSARVVAVLPLTAVTERDGKPVAWVVDAQTGQVAPRPITVTAWREDGVAIAAGLQPGERFVVAGVHKLAPGQKVRPVAADAPVALQANR